MCDIDEVIKSANNPDDYADYDTHIYVLYDLVKRLAEEVRRLHSL